MATFFTRLQAYYDSHTRRFNSLINLGLVLAAIISYCLLLLLFLASESLGIDSLVSPEAPGIKPTVTAALLTAIVSASTLAFLTRAVEHHFWLKLAPGAVGPPLAAAEVQSLAEWTELPVSRLHYIFLGRSWTLKISGLLLLATTVLTPVIVSGISQDDRTQQKIDTLPPDRELFSGWMDESNSAYRAGSARDLPGEVAASVSLSNLSAPAAETVPTRLSMPCREPLRRYYRHVRLLASRQHRRSSRHNKLHRTESHLHQSTATICLGHVDNEGFTGFMAFVEPSWVDVL